MLGSRTKHVVSYGRRSRRIVNRSEEENTQSQTRDAMQVLEPTLVGETQYGPSVNPIPPPHNSNQAKPSQRIPPLPPPRSPKPVTRKKGKLSPKAAKATRSISARKPLGSLAANVLAPSAELEGRHKRPSLEKGARLKLSLPLASVDIVVLDKHGKRLSQEKRQIRNDVQTNPNGKISAKLHQKYGRISDDTFNIDSDREDAIPVVRPSRGGRFRPIVVSSDEESDVKPPLPSSSKLSNVNTFHKASSSKRSKISQPTSEDEVSIPILEHIASQIPGNSVRGSVEECSSYFFLTKIYRK